MKVIIPGPGKPRLLNLDVGDLLRQLWEQPPRECVICGGPTKTLLINANTSKAEYVHDHWETDEGDALDCKIVWRQRNRATRKPTREQWRERNRHDLMVQNIFESDFPDDMFLHPRDTWHDYESYIASYEWEIKATAAKRLAKWCCQRCQYKGNKTTLHAHHRHYRTLYKERPQDIEVLCIPCHETEHGL